MPAAGCSLNNIQRGGGPSLATRVAVASPGDRRRSRGLKVPLLPPDRAGRARAGRCRRSVDRLTACGQAPEGWLVDRRPSPHFRDGPTSGSASVARRRRSRRGAGRLTAAAVAGLTAGHDPPGRSALRRVPPAPREQVELDAEQEHHRGTRPEDVGPGPTARGHVRIAFTRLDATASTRCSRLPGGRGNAGARLSGGRATRPRAPITPDELEQSPRAVWVPISTRLEAPAEGEKRPGVYAVTFADDVSSNSSRTARKSSMAFRRFSVPSLPSTLSSIACPCR